MVQNYPQQLCLQTKQDWVRLFNVHSCYWVIVIRRCRGEERKREENADEANWVSFLNELKLSWGNCCRSRSKKTWVKQEAPKYYFIQFFCFVFHVVVQHSFHGDWFIYQSIGMTKLFKSDDNKFHFFRIVESYTLKRYFQKAQHDNNK